MEKELTQEEKEFILNLLGQITTPVLADDAARTVRVAKAIKEKLLNENPQE